MRARHGLEEVEHSLGQDDGGAAQGQRPDLLALVERDRLAVLKVALGYVQNPTDAEDVAQDVFLKAYQQLRAGVPLHQLTRAWMLTVTVHAAVDRRRSSWFRHAVLVDRVPERATADQGPEEETLANDRRGHVLTAVGELPLALRQVVWLYYFGTQDIHTVAKTLRVSESAVKTRLFRARERLFPLLQGVWEEDRGSEGDRGAAAIERASDRPLPDPTTLHGDGNDSGPKEGSISD
jgi:RNA polymerase sigma-70 factor (ECF subfamily)